MPPAVGTHKGSTAVDFDCRINREEVGWEGHCRGRDTVKMLAKSVLRKCTFAAIN